MPKYSKKKEIERNDPSKAQTPEECMKWEIAREIGVYDKVLCNGWKSLSEKESGRIGGILATRKKNSIHDRGN